ncbi:hypothetical protein GAY28_10115 [Azospirillum brasilense]|nr:hypothetical protein [Azospirillum brasilense]
MDEQDRLIYANAEKRRLYPFLDYSAPQTFETMLRSSWEHGASRGMPVPKNPEEHLAYAKLRRMGARLEFMRRYPTNLVCAHVRVQSGMNAQIRVDAQRAGLERFFVGSSVSIGLMEAIRQKEEAEQRAAALDCLAFGVAIVGPDCKIKFMNSAMTSLISHGDGLFLDDLNRLAAEEPDDHQQLVRLVIMACMEKLSHGAATVSIRGVKQGHAHTVSISQGAKGSKTAVLVVAPARIDTASVSGVLQRDFRFTPAEADLAAMIGNGIASEEVSRELGKAASTGRYQVKSILNKLDRGQIANRGQIGIARWVSVLWAITGAARFRGKS